MLKIVTGDLFDYAAPGSIIAHGCNLQGVMNSGFAKQIRLRFPENYLAYRQAWRERALELGSFILVNCSTHHIFNALIQVRYGRDPAIQYVEYAAVKKSLRHAADYGRAYNVPIHLPLIGGGLGGGDSTELLHIFEEVFIHTQAVLYIQKD
jgi:O-acetyl-ADP-ribose deacetylase (regulator of RNase III)